MTRLESEMTVAGDYRYESDWLEQKQQGSCSMRLQTLHSSNRISLQEFPTLVYAQVQASLQPCI